VKQQRKVLKQASSLIRRQFSGSSGLAELFQGAFFPSTVLLFFPSTFSLPRPF